MSCDQKDRLELKHIQWIFFNAIYNMFLSGDRLFPHVVFFAARRGRLHTWAPPPAAAASGSTDAPVNLHSGEQKAAGATLHIRGSDNKEREQREREQKRGPQEAWGRVSERQVSGDVWWEHASWARHRDVLQMSFRGSWDVLEGRFINQWGARGRTLWSIMSSRLLGSNNNTGRW